MGSSIQRARERVVALIAELRMRQGVRSGEVPNRGGREDARRLTKFDVCIAHTCMPSLGRTASAYSDDSILRTLGKREHCGDRRRKGLAYQEDRVWERLLAQGYNEHVNRDSESLMHSTRTHISRYSGCSSCLDTER